MCHCLRILAVLTNSFSIQAWAQSDEDIAYLSTMKAVVSAAVINRYWPVLITREDFRRGPAFRKEREQTGQGRGEALRGIRGH